MNDRRRYRNLFDPGLFSRRCCPAIAEEVDGLFKNSMAPTKTETEKAFIMGFVSMLGNVQFLISSICLAVIFAVSLVAANTMAMSIRERVREIGILKTLGFRKAQVLGLLLSESLFLAMSGAGFGALSARLIFQYVPMQAISNGFIQNFEVQFSTIAVCILIGAVIGLLAAGLPAWQAARRPTLAALQSVG